MTISSSLPPHITEKSVQESVEFNLAKLVHTGDFRVLEDCILTAEDLCRSMPSGLMGMADRLVNEISDVVSKVTPCRKGCSHCCNMAVSITSGEAQAIKDRYGLSFRSVKKIPDPQSVQVQRWMGVPCPFLKDHACSIYDVRPAACRTFFNLSEYPELCDVVQYPGSDVPSLDLRPLWALCSIASYVEGFSFGDIRDFFPYGFDDEVQSL